MFLLELREPPKLEILDYFAEKNLTIRVAPLFFLIKQIQTHIEHRHAKKDKTQRKKEHKTKIQSMDTSLFWQCKFFCIG